jgi:hypothetical protein
VHNAQAEQVADSRHQLQPVGNPSTMILGLLLQLQVQAADGQPPLPKNHRSKKFKKPIHPFLVINQIGKNQIG